MKKIVMMTAAAALLGSALVLPAMARDDDSADWENNMMGGNCAMFGFMGRGMMMHDGRMGHGWMRNDKNLDAMVDGRLAYLKSALKITAEQKPAWDAYAEAVKDRVNLMQDMHGSMMETMHEGTAVERMDARITAMEAMLEAMKAVQAPTKALYETLSDSQKKKADDLIGLGCGAM